MDFRPWTLVVGQMIAAGGPQRIPVGIAWPLHVALRELRVQAARQGLLGRLPDFAFELSPECGLRVAAADRALEQLIEAGLLQRTGTLVDAALEVDAERLVAYRREVMRLDAELAQLLQRAGSRWAALASTCWKNAPTPARSSATTVAALIA
jgi:hypothetical protein